MSRSIFTEKKGDDLFSEIFVLSSQRRSSFVTEDRNDDDCGNYEDNNNHNNNNNNSNNNNNNNSAEGLRHSYADDGDEFGGKPELLANVTTAQNQLRTDGQKYHFYHGRRRHE